MKKEYITLEGMKHWVEKILNNKDEFYGLKPEEYIKSIPRVDNIALPKGTPVIIRCDVDVKIKNGEIDDDTRLRTALRTINYCIQNGWKIIICGHIGRDPKLSLRPVAKRFSELLERDVIFIDDWLDVKKNRLLPNVYKMVSKMDEGDLILLENTRKYDIERALWKQEVDESIIHAFYSIVMDFRKISNVFINEAIASSNRDMSSCIIPFSMDKVALGFFFYEEVEKYFSDVRDADVVVFSGLKMDKLDDLLGIVNRGKVKYVISAGALAMPLKKAKEEIDGKHFSVGMAECERYKDEKFYVSCERIEKAIEIINSGVLKGIEFVLPQDFILNDESISEMIPYDKLQFDIGPKTIKMFERKIKRFIEYSKNKERILGEPAILFYNGVFGKFEDPKFEGGTKWFIKQLKRMKENGVKIYVGGGEGAKALKKYGDVGWVEHVFTCGGTVLTAMTDEPIPPLKAMLMRCNKLCR